LNGGGGSNILLGGDGWDMLIGGPRRDILIGGRGSDMLLGGPGDDILIGARTTMDPDEAPLAPGFDQALLAVLVEWNKETPYEERVGALRSRIVALDDGAPDLLVGCAGRDWFFATLGTQKRDRILDRHFNEFVEPVV
jgi:Ca2+-binding RTX toxin-like protein